MHTDPHGARPSAGHEEALGEELGQALRSKLDLRLSALRASLESLARDLGGDPRGAGVDRALEEVTRTGRTVRDLADYAQAPVPMPLPCTLEEIAYSARHRLELETRERVLVAHFDRRRRILVDGPLLSRVIERLARNATEASDAPVLIAARLEGDDALFTVVNARGSAALDARWAEAPFHTSKPDRLGLGLALAKRDVEVLGGTLVLARTPRGETVVTVRVPHIAVQRPGAEI